MKWNNTQQFYKSKEWESFRQIAIENNTASDGFVYCAICGKPILKKYDLIVHHKKELDDLNVNDFAISLNEANVECVHFKCHNQIHERFGFNKTSAGGYKVVQKHVYIVYGSPCAGKTTWVHDNASEYDLVVDLDSIWQMISTNARYIKPNELKAVVFEVRDKLYDVVKYRNGRWHNAYIITGSPLKGDRERLKQRINADEFIFIQEDKTVCLKRLLNRNDMNEDEKEKWKTYIDDWFSRYQPD